jgi:hypothetical protein
MHDDTRSLFERLVTERAVLQVYRIDEFGRPWAKCPCPSKREQCADELAIDGFDEWEFV